ncbi:MAG: PAS domain S-box protein [Desulfobacteraceae bacterium]|nr:PAS domain S-box protein [Desulfobacteraceae bacterium]
MLKIFKSSTKPWIFGIIILLFFLILSYGFIVFLNTRGFSAAIDSIRIMGKELREEVVHKNYFEPEAQDKIKIYFSKKISKNNWINTLDIFVQENDKEFFILHSLDNHDFFIPSKEQLTSISYSMDNFQFQMFYPLELDSRISSYLYVKGNIFYFLKLTYMTKIYVGLSLLCFFFIGWYFLRQYLRLQDMIEIGRKTEKILAEKSGSDEIIARFARSVLLSNSMDEASVSVNEAVSSMTGADYIVSGFIDEGDSDVNLFISSYKSEQILGEPFFKKTVSNPVGICGKSIASGRGLYINQADGENSILPGKNEEFRANSVIAVPAVVKDKVVGIIAAGSRTIEFNLANQNQLERIAALYAVAIQKQQAFLKVVERENQFRVTFKTNPDAVLITTFPEGIIIDVNDGFTNLTGYKAEEVKGHSTMNFFLWEKREDRDKMLGVIENEHKITNFEARFRLRSGELVTGLFSGSKIVLNGKTHLLSIVREIEKLKQTENELRKERAFLSKVVETSPAGIIAVNGRTGKILYANQRTADILGLDIEEIQCRYFHDDSWDIRDFNLNKLDKSHYIFNILRREKKVLHDIKHVVTNGKNEKIYLSFNATPIIGDDGEIDMFVTSLEDVSQKVATQRSLKEAEERLNSVISSLPVILWAVNKDGLITLCRGMGLKPFGIKPDSLVGKSVFRLYKNFDQVTSLIGEGLKLRTFTKVIKFLERYYEVTVSPIMDDNNNLLGLSGVAADISRRVKMEEEQAILSAAIEQAVESIVITDKHGKIIYVNPAFENITGYFKDEVIGKNPNIVKSGYHGRFFYDEMWTRLNKGMTWNGYLKNKSKDGILYEEEASISPVFDRTGEIQHFVAVKRDVTQERKMESQLRKAQKLEAIGTLAGGIAHDFNNILFPIIGFSELLSNKYEKGSEEKRYVNNVLSAAYRARDLVHQILTFSRQNEEEKRPVRIDIIVHEALKLLRASIPSTIEIRTEIESSSLTVLADSTKIHQLAMNLGTNAYQAMEAKGGVLGIYLKAVDIDDEDIDRSVMTDINSGKYLRFTVSDTGTGIPAHILERIFDPYFTTKPQGKGTGLGLATVHGIVQSCKGFIRVYSEEGKGSSFNVFLPVTTDLDYSKDKILPSKIVGGAEHILVADDEELIVEVIGDMLKDLGYKTTLRTSSIEAFEAFKAHPENFDLLVTDHTMPNMTGFELARKIHMIRPGLPVIVCSGFSEIVTMDKAKKDEISSFIMKPVLKTDLAAAVRKAIDEVKNESLETV